MYSVNADVDDTHEIGRKMVQGTMQKPQFYTVAEVAELTRVSRMTVYRMVHAGELPAIRMGGSYRVPKNVVDQLLSGAGIDMETERISA